MKTLETLGNNEVQDILDEMGMIDENGNCPYTAEEIFKAGVEWTIEKNGWHTVDEKPPVDERGISDIYIVIDKHNMLYKAYCYINEKENLYYWVEFRDWNMPEIVIDTKLWCKLPVTL